MLPDPYPDGSPQLQPNCLHDMELMCTFVQHRYRGQELGNLKCCHMFVHAIWLLDICNGMGTEILTDCWAGSHPLDSPYCWPPTVISSTNWRLCQQALQTCFGLDCWRKLSHPLGKWIPAVHQSVHLCWLVLGQ